MKRFSTVRDTQRGSQNNMKKRRGRKEIDEQEEKEGDSRGERQIYAVLCSLSVPHSSEHPQRFKELY